MRPAGREAGAAAGPDTAQGGGTRRAGLAGFRPSCRIWTAFAHWSPRCLTLSAAVRPAVQGRAHAARDAGFGALAGWEGR